jgi:hypothetical protein
MTLDHALPIPFSGVLALSFDANENATSTVNIEGIATATIKWHTKDIKDKHAHFTIDTIQTSICGLRLTIQCLSIAYAV